MINTIGGRVLSSLRSPDPAAEAHDVVPMAAGEPEIDGVPAVSATWYQNLVEFANGTPGWVHLFAEVGTEALPILLVVLMAVNWWRSRRLGAAVTAQAFLAPTATAIAYFISDIAKSIIQQPRPCQAMDLVSIAPCSPMGDWSFPSNHTTFAMAAAVGLAIAWRRTMPWVLTGAVLTGFSRVFVGAHYPHDVVVGLALGAAVAAAIMFGTRRPTTTLVTWASGVPALRWAVATGRQPDATEPATVRLPATPAAPTTSPGDGDPGGAPDANSLPTQRIPAAHGRGHRDPARSGMPQEPTERIQVRPPSNRPLSREDGRPAARPGTPADRERTTRLRHPR
ncbi:phosphatase PAP2 family protein [Actinoalloteichus hymeniacidonis]|uniref:phosphatase PAP2 family protein n=1 Tax=Actinoalloteichus hymeniacidonis TaxID=340345 RepID=UPI00156059B9|nr:phosphatase PAP2 family protein [Actinoalloteichus hymeniacidonis]MBB5909164.1 membrane-associated phospholipid phosphatase [Actinoalloteichus hymeniacidonis]